MGDERFEMLPAADTLHVFLRGERGMPGEDLEAVEPAVLDHEEPSCAAKAVAAANGARRAFCDCVIHRVPFENQQPLTAARVRKRGPAPSPRGTVSIPRVGSKRSVK